jgi:putative nucleotidyltransferase with HDIG domain
MNDPILNDLKEHEPTTFKHSIRVAGLLVSFGKYLKFRKNELTELFLIGLYHDIGKLNIERNILRKEGKLSDLEYKEILNHPLYGEEILLKEGFSGTILESVRSHHENYNGSGYPDNLTYHDIPFYAFLIRIVDSYDAMTSFRTYQYTKSKYEAIQEIRSLKEDWYHPNLVESFTEFISKINP